LDYSGSNGNQANGNDDDEEDLENLVRHCERLRYMYLFLERGILYKVFYREALS